MIGVEAKMADVGMKGTLFNVTERNAGRAECTGVDELGSHVHSMSSLLRKTSPHEISSSSRIGASPT